MIERVVMRRVLLAPATLRGSCILPPTRHLQRSPSRTHSTGLQSVTQPSFWASLVPKPLRRSSTPSSNVKKLKSKDWNPATFYIIIFLLIGSMSIQMIALRNEFNAFSRRADAKIDLLKEVIQRVQNGEKVDVEGLLGTGDPEKEKEWEEVLKEIEDEDELWAEARRKKPKRIGHAPSLELKEALTPNDDTVESIAKDNGAKKRDAKPKTKSNAPPGFY